jgi:glucose dehydrogenase
MLFMALLLAGASPGALADTQGAQYAKKNWPTYGGDLANTRYSKLKQINTSNVDQLEMKWVFQTGLGADIRVNFQISPIVVDGVMYVSDPGHFGTLQQNVFALDARTGVQIWHTPIELHKSRDVEFLGMRPHSGVAYGNGKVYMTTFDARVWALDAKTGDPVEGFSDGSSASGGFVTVGDPDLGHYLRAAPIFVPKALVPKGGPASGHDLILIGIGGSDNGIRGFFSAYDAETGELLWRFSTVPEPQGEFVLSWPNLSGTPFDKPQERGGAGVWVAPALDKELGLVLIGTGNASPSYDGTHREGNNELANAIVALNAATGERVWHFQEVHHDLWDYDQASPPVVYSMRVNGKKRKVVSAAGKTGWNYILDRETGVPIHPCPEKQVPTYTDVISEVDDSPELPSPTQPVCESDAFVPQGGRYASNGKWIAPIFTPPGLGVEGNPGLDMAAVRNEEIPVISSNVLTEPGIIGGVDVAPVAHSPELGLTFIVGNIAPAYFTSNPQEAPLVGNYFGAAAGSWDWHPAEFPFPFGDWAANLTAMDVETGKIAWQRTVSTFLPQYNGACATAGGLVFAAESIDQAGLFTPQWTFSAFSAQTGERLWSWEVPGNVGVQAPCMTYSVNGRQFVAVAVGNRSQGRLDSPTTPHGDYFYAFGLPDRLIQDEGDE